MTMYLLAYDLHHKPETVYSELISTLEAGRARRVQQSVWCIETTWTAAQVYAWAARKMRRGDELIVTEILKTNTVATLGTRSWSALFGHAIVEQLLRLTQKPVPATTAAKPRLNFAIRSKK